MRIVQKYGGSSLANTDKINRIADKITAKTRAGFQLAIVVSANGDTTDMLIRKASEVNPDPESREMDMLISTGEQISASLLTMALHRRSVEAVSVNAFQLGIRTNDEFSSARIINIDSDKLDILFKKNNVVVVTGFQGITEENEITTLGRGGSDTSAVALAAVMDVECEIFSDYDGIFSVDPRLCPNSKKLETVTYDEMLEMSKLGAKVLHTRSVEIAKKYSVILRCASSFNDEGGTKVVAKNIEAPVVTGLSVQENQTQITISGVPLDSGITHEIFEIASRNNWNVDMISVIQVDDHVDISFTVIETVLDDLKRTFHDLIASHDEIFVKTDPGFAKVSVVGLGMRSESGVAARFFKALSKKEITVKMVTTSEIKISVLIQKEDIKNTVDVLTKEFDLCTE